MGEIPDNAAALAGLEQLVKGWIRQVVQEEHGKLLAQFRRELDRQDQYGTARQVLAGAALPPEVDDVATPVAARLLGLSSSNTLLQQLRRGDADLAACVTGGTGKGRRFSRARVLALKQRRAG